jgi:5-methylcytosine-specific restriction protein A
VGQLALYFQKQTSAVQAELAGAGKSVRALVVHVQNQVIPWIGNEVGLRTNDFKRKASAGGNEIRQRLDQVWAMSDLRLADKQDKWKLYHWNSLRTTARKGGCHTTWRGDHIDICEDICGVLVGDVILAWTTYRDYLIQKHIDEVTDEFSQKLQGRLREAATQTADPNARQAIERIIEELETITFAQREELLRQVDSKVRQLQSIRAPAKDFIQQSLASTFDKIKIQGGTGCQQRMRELLLDGFQRNIDQIRAHLSRLIQSAVDKLMDACASALREFGDVSSSRIAKSVGAVAELSRLADERELKVREEVLTEAIDSLKKNRFQSQADYWAWHNTLYPGGSADSPEWRELSRSAKERDGFRCVLCGCDDDELHTDHIVPLSRNGSNDLANLQTLCVTCHETKTGRRLRRGWPKSPPN